MQETNRPEPADERMLLPEEAENAAETGLTEVPGGKKKKRKDREKKKKNIPLRLLIAAVCLALLFAAYRIVMGIRPAHAGEEIDEEFVTPDYLDGRTMNVLICGLDIDEGRTEYMTDVILMANFDLETNRATLLQIPRDTYVGHELVPYGKINGLYNWGFSDTLPEETPENRSIMPLVETIYNQMKLPVDNYVMITMEGFRKAIDLMGGIEISVEEDVDFEGLFALKAGETYTLNGETAEVFIRYRATYEQADIQRLRMQQVFMQALMQKLMTLSLSDMASLATNIFSDLNTDLSIQQILDLANEAKQLDMSAVTVVRVPGEPVPAYGLYGVDVFSVHKKELADLLNEYMRPYQDSIPESELGAIEIQNIDGTWSDDPSSLADDPLAGTETGENPGDGGTE